MDGDLFNPPGIEFKPISRNAIKTGLLGVSFWTVIGMIIVAVAAVVTKRQWVYYLEIILIALLIWQAWLIPRQVRAWGYAEGEKDLYIRRGIMFKKMWAVPYGRMQFVDVTQGPVDRFFGIADVSLKTASTESNASIPALPREEADRIRVILTERGEALRAGL